MSKTKTLNIDLENHKITGADLVKELDSDVKYSLDIDVENKYNFTDKEKKFLKVYIDTKSIPLSAQLTNTSVNEGFALIESYRGQNEIRRINQALYQRRFAHKILTLDEIAAWLSSGITDEGVMSSDRFDVNQKMRASQMLIDLQTLKSTTLSNPDMLLYNDIETDVKKLSLKSIKKMIHQQSIEDQTEEKMKIIEKLNVNNLFTSEEITYLKTLSINELQNMLEVIQKETAVEVKENK